MDIRVGQEVDIKVPQTSIGALCGRGKVTALVPGHAWVQVTHRGLRPARVLDGEVIMYRLDRLVPR